MGGWQWWNWWLQSSKNDSTTEVECVDRLVRNMMIGKWWWQWKKWKCQWKKVKGLMKKERGGWHKNCSKWKMIKGLGGCQMSRVAAATMSFALFFLSFYLLSIILQWVGDDQRAEMSPVAAAAMSFALFIKKAAALLLRLQQPVNYHHELLPQWWGGECSWNYYDLVFSPCPQWGGPGHGCRWGFLRGRGQSRSWSLSEEGRRSQEPPGIKDM